MESTEFAKTINGYRKVLIVLIVCFSFLLLAVGYLFIVEKKNHENKIYVISDTGRFIARQTDNETMYDFDIKNHLKVFSTNMFAYDQYNYKSNIEVALNLVDVSGGKRIYNDVKTSGIYENLKKYNARTIIKIDSIYLDMKVRPIKADLFITQTVLYADQKAELAIGAKMDLVSANRSEENPFGILITNFDYIPYNKEVINTVNAPSGIEQEKITE